MKILFLSTRQSKPSFRFRVEAMLPFFEQRQHDCEVAFLPPGTWSRFALFRRFRQFDAVLIQKRLFSGMELALIRRYARRLIYDVDDAVMFNGRGVENTRRRTRFRSMVRAADLTICGNAYLDGIARDEGGRAVVIPTAVDTELFHPCKRPRHIERKHDRLITVGWTGSRSTNRYLNELFPVLAQLAGRVQVKILSDGSEEFEFKRLGEVSHTFIPWSPAVEISEPATFDVGLMPLPDNRWTRGKCGFKALQYMALGIPAVCSPVGANCEIISDGKNGFLPETPQQWHQILTRLIEDATLRERIGQAGRVRVESAYALNVHGPNTVAAIEKLATAVSRRSA